MKGKRWDILVFCVIFTVIGAGGGWYAARQASGTVHDPGSEDEPDTAAGAGTQTEKGPSLPPQTLKNLGVTTGEVKPGMFTTYRAIPAVIERTPLSTQPVHAPMGGRIGELFLEPGVVVAAGQKLMTLIRDPISRPQLTLTEEILKPASEEVHKAAMELRKTGEEIKILETELDRVAKYTGKVSGEDLPILPRQRVIDLRYNLMRAQRAIEQARIELNKHGFTEAQVKQMAAGGGIPILGEESWKRALENNGLWSAQAQELFSTLPAPQRSQRWTIATIGELAAAGLVKAELIAWIKELGEDCGHFLEIGALLQQGYSVADLRALHDLNALDPIVVIKAPGEGRVPDWDVLEIMARSGARVSAGDRLATLLDAREMYLRTEPAGKEKADILRVLAQQMPCEARPLVKDAGPSLMAVTVSFVRSEAGGRGTVAYAKVENTPLATSEAAGAPAHRSWQLRAGLKYMLRVPTRILENVIVLPRGAVAADGPHQVAFLHQHGALSMIDVELVYQDEEVAVITKNDEMHLHPGDEFVLSGAYALRLALKGSSGPQDAHAGHGH